MGIEVSVGDDGIAEVVQNCPPVNALGADVRRGLVSAIDAAESDASAAAPLNKALCCLAG